MPQRPPFHRHALAMALSVTPWLALAAEPVADEAAALQDVVVSASRQAQRSFDAPASVQSVNRAAIEAAGPRVNLSEVMTRVPGITVLNRQNYAQDLQLSIRGSGARAPFGIRGARLIVDGIPATMPDGQGQASTISLPSAERIEVLRGPLAQLYGNSAGGVLQVFTAAGPQRPEITATYDAGPQRLHRVGLQAGGQQGTLNYLLDLSQFQTDGWRQNSAAERKQLNARLRWQASEQTRVTVVANAFDQPESGDPLGLTRAQAQQNPRQAVSNSTLYKAGKEVAQNQLGVVVDHRIDAHSDWMARVYAGERDLGNRLSTPLSAQTSATAAGGMVDLDRVYSGVGLQYSRRTALSVGQLRWLVGLDHERMREHRLGYINNLGVQGTLKRDEQDGVTNSGLFTQADWAFHEDWSAVAGLRVNEVRFKVEDAYIRTGNPDDSGNVAFHATNPVVGITRHLGARTNVYANIGRGFETPTLTEIAYKASGSGPNLDLKASPSTHTEVGLKSEWWPGHRVDAALFHIDTQREIVVASNTGGRAVYTNAGQTRRVGVELQHTAQWAPEWRTHVALTALKAEFAQAYKSSSGATVAAGNRIPGVANRSLFAELAWQPRALPGFTGGLELVHRGSIAVDDVNSDRAEAATLLNLSLRWEQKVGAWKLRESLRVDNLEDRATIGSVIANDANGRFFEPAPGRQWGVGLSATLMF